MSSSNYLTVPGPSAPQPKFNPETNHLSIRSLSELYLSPNQRGLFTSNPILSSVLLNNLRNRLKEYEENQFNSAENEFSSPNFVNDEGSDSKSIGSSNTSAPSSPTKKTRPTPLETLFHTPEQYFRKQPESAPQSPSVHSRHHNIFNMDTESNPSIGSSSKDSRSNEIQKWLYDSLNHPSNPLAIFYHLVLSLLFLIYIFLVFFTDRTTWQQYCKPIGRPSTSVSNLKTTFERSLLVYFVLCEYLVRFYAARSQPYYEGLPLWRCIIRYHSKLAHLFDLTIVICGVIAATCRIPLPLDFTQDVYALIVLRGLHRLFNVAQWAAVHARHSPWSLMAEVFQEQGSLLFGIFYLETLLVFCMAYFVFLAETHSVEQTDQVTIKNMADALYWSSITLLTIGYGDKAPVTIIGKAITSFGIMLGLGLFALPSGIIATSLAIKLNEQDQIRTRSERRTLAAILIQRFWRFERRRHRFALAELIIETHRQPESYQTAEPSSSSTATIDQPTDQLKLRIDMELFENLEHLVSRKIEFIQTQFLDIIKIQLARKKFIDLLKRNNRMIMQSNSNRHLIKQHWLEHRQLTEILEMMHTRLDRYVQMDMHPNYKMSFEGMEKTLERINQRLKEQKTLLKKLNPISCVEMK
ncbi:Potassium voltage-gated channel sub KQT member 4 [Blomia tropicalis]|nr:Potassium voltage-gated channel sub KQT member 4 [Blomia tropicalis]